ncbi:prepilin-type N-terminal cleavage/methylation domain-containing protein [Neobacillus rhizophilus]|uniref:Prepilin-type N-terminal cleavage/methylation domain-containing protein n=1 Tax=Neobacillus rhizophilus TaxID=2833579 RepID=A0A942UDV1_9BACI|nr:prepilin-type N-terminal cleavage/methylation domain-containing protein [Neobacillus rhizophilus]MBS4215469.1 prepilin-type N-terminal cleavage/methylation domain-containing protein [Neobacillus rhizophilus]
MKRGEQGLTLVEVLATLVILSIISISIWSVFFQGYNYSKKAISKNSMIQEANLLITELTSIHQSSDKYVFESLDCKITVTVDDKLPSKVFEHQNLCYKTNISSITIFPKQNGGNLQLTITIYEKNNPRNEVSVSSKLYRIKGGVNYE